MTNSFNYAQPLNKPKAVTNSPSSSINSGDSRNQSLPQIHERLLMSERSLCPLRDTHLQGRLEWF